MSKVNRIGLLKKGFFIEFLDKTSVSTSYFPYKTVRAVAYEHKEDKVYIKSECEENTYTLEITGDCLVSTRKNGSSHFCERVGKERILNLYNQLTMEYMTNHYDKD